MQLHYSDEIVVQANVMKTFVIDVIATVFLVCGCTLIIDRDSKKHDMVVGAAYVLAFIFIAVARMRGLL